MKQYSIGLDIGIASVGWSVINSETGYIEDLGVRLFSSRNSDANKERRNARGTRRLSGRRRTRLNDAKFYLQKHGFKRDSKHQVENPYELRVKGLTEELNKEQIYAAITHILKKRGISYLSDEDAESSGTDGKTYTEEVNRNRQLLKEFTPGQIQLHRLNENARVRSGVNPKGNYQLNIFTVSAYAKELESILKTQAKYHPEITDEFINFFVGKDNAQHLGLVYRKRPYYHGPGNAENPSKYGRWADYPTTGKPADNIFDKLIGTDLRGLVRASSNSISAQKFNLLNDLNNLTLPREDHKLTTEEKQDILAKLLHEDVKSYGPNDLAKSLGFTAKEINGWRKDKNEKPLIHSLKRYRNWRGIFAEYGIDIATINDATLDEIAFIATLNTDLDAIVATIESRIPELDENVRKVVEERFSDLRKKESEQTWHRFSSSTLNLLIPELLHTSDEQNTILERLGVKQTNRNQYAAYHKLPTKEIIQEIFNPTVSKSINQALKVFNELIKKYGKENIVSVVVEMPRDKNEDDQKKIISTIQKKNEGRKLDSKKYFLEKSGWSEIKFETEFRKSRFAQKLFYYFEQDGKCAYTGKAIQPEELLSGVTEVDHIIPLSISFDDSLNNKVLVTAHANQIKGQHSPYEVIGENKLIQRSWSDFEEWVKKNKSFNKYKKRNLLDTRSMLDPAVRDGFIARNLNDTRYASRVVLNTIQSFFNQQNATKVYVINGSFTHTLRKKWGKDLDKTRETHHHHAVDATLCAVRPYVNVTPFEFEYSDEGKLSRVVDLDTGEILTPREFMQKDFYDKKNYVPQWDNFIEQLVPLKLHKRIKFSHQIDKKSNRKVANATLYSTRGRIELAKSAKDKEKIEDYIIGTIKDIYTDEGYKAFIKQKDNLLMKDIDPKTYEHLMKISAEYPDTIEKVESSGKVTKVGVSPFKLYCEDNGIPAIQKYSRKGNGPIIRKVKYYDKKLGSHINITKNQEGYLIDKTDNGRKVCLTSLKPWRADVYYNPETENFELMGIKYNHLKFYRGAYGIPRKDYENLKIEEGIGAKSEFKFSLYKRNVIQIETDKEIFEGLFSSKISGKNKIEIKPICKSKWESNELLKVIGKSDSSGRVKIVIKNRTLAKINTDILGNQHKITSEQLTGIIED